MSHRNNDSDRREQRRSRRIRSTTTICGRHSRSIKIVVLLTSIFIAFISWKYQRASSSEINQVSKLLLSYARTNKQFMETFEIMTYLLHHDPLSDMISEKLRPVQDRLGSLRTQTGIYERMETKIPGGPTQFMTSTLNELDKIVEDQILPLEEEANSLLIDDRTRINEVVEMAIELIQSQRSLVKSFLSEQMDILVEQGVNLVPEAYTGEVEEANRILEEQSRGLTFEFVNDQIQHLGELYELQENILEKEDYLFEPREPQPPQIRAIYASERLYVFPLRAEGADRNKYSEVKEQLREIHVEISREIDENRNIYELSMPFRNSLVNKLDSVLQLLKDSIERRRLPYLRLKEMILKDIANMKIRVSNLQYKYVKIKPIE